MPKASSKRSTGPYMTGRDLRHVTYLPLLTAIAWFLPERAWPRAAMALARVPKRLALYRLGDAEAGVVPVDGQTRAADRILRLLQVLRENRPGGWRPDIGLEGAEHLASALEVGQGAILWVADMRAASLVAKKAIGGAGHAIAHLSRPEHGISRSPFGIAYLNGLVRRAEDGYLDERVRITAGEEMRAMARLRALLGENRIISITASGEGRVVNWLPFGGGCIALATGAPALAHASGAALLPVFAVETGPGRFRVVIEAPIPVDRDAKRPVAIRAASEAFLARHVPYVAANPREWRGYSYLRATHPDDGGA